MENFYVMQRGKAREVTRLGPALGLCSLEELGGLASIQDGADGCTEVLQSPCYRYQNRNQKKKRSLAQSSV